MYILSAVETTLKTKKVIKIFKATPFDDLPTIKIVCNRVCVQSSGTIYRGTEITNFEIAIEYFILIYIWNTLYGVKSHHIFGVCSTPN